MTIEASAASHVLTHELTPFPKRSSASIVLGLVLTALGGFLGGLFMNYGPTYVNLVVAQMAPEVDSATLLAVEPPVQPVQPLSTAEELQASDESPALAHLVVHANQKHYLVLDSAPASGLGSGRVIMHSEENDFEQSATMRVKASRVPKQWSSYLNSDFALYGSGYTCTAQATDFRLLRQISGDLDQEESTESGFMDTAMLVVKLETKRGNCKDAAWAQAHDAPTPALGHLHKPGRKLTRAARRAFRQTKVYAQAAKEYREEHGLGRWDLHEDVEFSVRLIRSKNEEMVFVRTVTEVCGGAGSSLGVLFQRSDSGELTLVDVGHAYVQGIVAAADFDNDGDLDLIVGGDAEDTALLRRGSGFVEETLSTVDIRYCRC